MENNSIEDVIEETMVFKMKKSGSNDSSDKSSNESDSSKPQTGAIHISVMPLDMTP